MPIKHSLPIQYEPHPSRSNFKNLTGQRFGRLFILGYGGRKTKWGQWWWRCDCGNVGLSYGHIMRSGDGQSCGCRQREVAQLTFTTHGGSRFSHRGDKGHPLYAVWIAMKQRCYNARCKSYPSYGGRGITVCDRWRLGEDERTGFECFALDMGTKPSKKHSMGRIDNDGGYSPENCRWETVTDQLSNRRKYKTRKDKGVMRLRQN